MSEPKYHHGERVAYQLWAYPIQGEGEIITTGHDPSNNLFYIVRCADNRQFTVYEDEIIGKEEESDDHLQ